MRRTYKGKSVEVTFDLAQCTHIGECIRRLPEVFALDRRPWISPDAVTADELASVIERCPSGALQFHRLDGGAEERGPATPRVTAIRNGPLLVRGRIDVRREDGSVETMPRAALCRCGQSANKPFCDNTHLRVGFKAPGEVFKIEMSPVRITPDHPIDRATDPRAVS